MSRIRGELEVAVQISFGDTHVEGVDELIYFHQLHDAFDLLARYEAQGCCCDDTEESIATDHVPE